MIRPRASNSRRSAERLLSRWWPLINVDRRIHTMLDCGSKPQMRHVEAFVRRYVRAVRQFFDNLNRYTPMNGLHRRTLTLRAELKFHGKGPTAHNPGGEFCAVGYFPQKRSKCRSNVTDRRPGFVECTPVAPREDPPTRQSRMESSREAR
jgi:hypothetical protein